MAKDTQLPEVLTRGVAEILPDAAALAKRMKEGPIRLYLGIDPTGSHLTLGHSVPLRKLQQFAELGHEVILLVGNGTVRIGDPTGRDSTRPMLTDKQIEHNFKNWKAQASKILDFDKIQLKYNGDWLDYLTYADMVKLLAKTTVQQLIERDMFQDRLKQNLPIHGHEILYPMLQGYDSVAMDVDLEVGGTDQTFNMMMGRTLQRVYNDREKWVLTTPIINGTDGRKMSKSYGNYVAITEEPNDMYGKLMRINDEMIIEYFTLLTDVPLTDIVEMEREMTAGSNPMEFKKKLAHTITSMYHDTAAATAAAEYFAQTTQQGSAPSDIPTLKLPKEITLLEAITTARPQDTRSNLRRLISQGGVRYNDEAITDIHHQLSPQSGDILRIGKRGYYEVE